MIQYLVFAAPLHVGLTVILRPPNSDPICVCHIVRA